jgi:hypothetical protein
MITFHLDEKSLFCPHRSYGGQMYELTYAGHLHVKSDELDVLFSYVKSDELDISSLSSSWR